MERVDISTSKIFRGDEHFALRDPHEQAIEKIFQEHGFVIAKGGKFNKNNPFEVGIGYPNMIDSKKVKSRLVRGAGIQTPRKIPLENVLSEEVALVAKVYREHGGSHKYLIETARQRAAIVTLALLRMTGIFHDSYNEVGPHNEWELTDLVRNRNIPLEYLDQLKQFPWWDIEEYIECPGNFYTSYRILADGFGNIHYGQLIRSAQEKGKKYIPSHRTGPVPIFEYSEPGVLIYDLLTHQRSPLYLRSKDVVSNVSRGGKRLLLNGARFDDKEDREVLKDHDIDPDNPKVPNYLLEKSSKVGVLNRGTYPYSGVDFIQDRSGKFYFLEANANPMINAEAVGLPKDTPSEAYVLEMMRRVAATPL